MTVYETIILCQPDRLKSCTACCGLFNFQDISRENLSHFLLNGAGRSSSYVSAGDYTDQGQGQVIRDMTSYICPHQGLIFNKRPGCLLHPQYRNMTMRNDSFFGEKICNEFLCPAHSIFSSDLKKLIIDIVDDWYYYTIAIIDPESIIWLMRLLEDKYAIILKQKLIIKSIINAFLNIHSKYLATYNGPIFFYSSSEYDCGKHDFSLLSGMDKVEEEKNKIYALIENNL